MERILGDDWTRPDEPLTPVQLMKSRELDPASIEGDRFEASDAQGSHAELEDEPGNPRDILPDEISYWPSQSRSRRRREEALEMTARTSERTSGESELIAYAQGWLA